MIIPNGTNGKETKTKEGILKELHDSISSLLPKDCILTKVEFEGPQIVLYLKNIRAFYTDNNLITKIAARIRKKILLRCDSSELMPEGEALEAIKKLIPVEAGVKEVRFDPNFNEVWIEALKPGLVIGKEGSVLKNILINSQPGIAAPVEIVNQRGSGSVTLLFNAVMDGNQLPLTAYQVDWGDGSKVAVSGTNLRDRSNTVAPYKLTHSYSYYEILSQNQAGDRIYCSATGETPPGFSAAGLPANWCAVKPRIQIQDNWGWCNGSIDPGSGALLGSQWGYRVGSGAPNCSTAAGGGENAEAWTLFGGVSANGYVIVGIND